MTSNLLPKESSNFNHLLPPSPMDRFNLFETNNRVNNIFLAPTPA